MKTNVRYFVVAGILLAAALAIFVSPFASSSPDGLERVAADEGFDGAADDSAVSDSPLADYGVEGIDDDRIATATAGVVGILATFGLGIGIFGLLRVMRPEPTSEAPADPATSGA
ncbi:MAG: PDGLE domain-containing protein [Acidimicrobiales bacterium]|nr:PDGLE domain-containing protein [Acidimicrobiales bacterium]